MTNDRINDHILDAAAVIRAAGRQDQQAMEAILKHTESWNIAIAIAQLFHLIVDEELGEAERADAYLDTLQRGLLPDRNEGSDK
jgi:hypothetical protein